MNEGDGIIVRKRNIKIIALRFISLLYGIIVAILTFGIYSNISMAGFPDGHLTEYDRMSKLPITIFISINIAFCIYFFFVALISVNYRSIKLYVVMGLHIIFFILTNYGIEYYFKYYLDLDYGQGG